MAMMGLRVNKRKPPGFRGERRIAAARASNRDKRMLRALAARKELKVSRTGTITRKNFSPGGRVQPTRNLSPTGGLRGQTFDG